MKNGNGTHFTDIQTLRERARKHISSGAVTAGYAGDRDQLIAVLNEALATELVCTLRYRYHYYMAQGIHANTVKQEFLEHANQELDHADRIAERITQLGGKPDFSPAGLAERSHAEYREGKDLVGMIEEDLVAERIAIDSYREIISFIGDDDPTTRRLMESILAMEEEHAEDLSTFLQDLGKKGEPASSSVKRAQLA